MDRLVHLPHMELPTPNMSTVRTWGIWKGGETRSLLLVVSSKDKKGDRILNSLNFKGKGLCGGGGLLFVLKKERRGLEAAVKDTSTPLSDLDL